MSNNNDYKVISGLARQRGQAWRSQEDRIEKDKPNKAPNRCQQSVLGQVLLVLLFWVRARAFGCPIREEIIGR